MAKKDSIPKRDREFADMLDNLVVKMPVHAVTLDITPGQITTVQNYAVMFNYLMDMQEAYKTYKQEVSAYKRLLRYGPGGGQMNPVPVTPTLLAAPALVNIAIERYLRNLFAQFKAHPNYDESVGEDLGIVGDEQIVDIHKLKPEIKSRIEDGKPVIMWTKGVTEAIDIYVDRNDGAGLVFLARDTHPDYTDTTPIPAGTEAVAWDYKCIYVIDDSHVGKYSNVLRVAVGK